MGYSEDVPENLSPNIICGAHAIPNKYVLESSMLSCAAMYNWTMKTLFADNISLENINAAVNNAPVGANGCLVLPYFQGRGTPDFNNKATGCFANLSLATTRDDMARALLESITYEAKINLDILENYIGKIKNVHIGGGLTKFDTFNQIQADVYQKELIYDIDSSEQTSFGAWANAAVALGVYDDYEKAMQYQNNKHKIKHYKPDKNNQYIYETMIENMKTLYSKLY